MMHKGSAQKMLIRMNILIVNVSEYNTVNVN